MEDCSSLKVVGLFTVFGIYSVVLFGGGATLGYVLKQSSQQISNPVIRADPSFPIQNNQLQTINPLQVPQVQVPQVQVPQVQVPQVQVPPNTDPLKDGNIGRKIMEQISRLQGVIIPEKGKDPSKIDQKKVVTIFFDPRCPYCHQLFRAIDGKISVKWVPVPVLQDTNVGIKSSFFILNAKKNEVGKAIDTAFSYVGEGSNSYTPQQTQDWLNKVEIPENKKHVLQDSVSAFVALHKERGINSFGVPSILVPHSDGSISIFDGYEPGDENKIINDFKKGLN